MEFGYNLPILNRQLIPEYKRNDYKNIVRPFKYSVYNTQDIIQNYNYNLSFNKKQLHSVTRYGSPLTNQLSPRSDLYKKYSNIQSPVLFKKQDNNNYYNQQNKFYPKSPLTTYQNQPSQQQMQYLQQFQNQIPQNIYNNVNTFYNQNWLSQAETNFQKIKQFNTQQTDNYTQFQYKPNYYSQSHKQTQQEEQPFQKSPQLHNYNHEYSETASQCGSVYYDVSDNETSFFQQRDQPKNVIQHPSTKPPTLSKNQNLLPPEGSEQTELSFKSPIPSSESQQQKPQVVQPVATTTTNQNQIQLEEKFILNKVPQTIQKITQNKKPGRNIYEPLPQRKSPNIDDLKILDIQPKINQFNNQNQAQEPSRSSQQQQNGKLYPSKENSLIESFKDLTLNIFKRESDKRHQCNCESNLGPYLTCGRALSWIRKKYNSEKDLEYLKQKYEKLCPIPDQEVESGIDIECLKQIIKDLDRTFPDNAFFRKDQNGIKMLKNVLLTYSKYDPQIGYVQGMNFIAGVLLYHAEEYIAFWLLVMIIEMFELRYIYLPKLPGVSKHIQIISFLILIHFPALHTHLCTYNIAVEFFCTEWILALFGSIITLEHMGDFYNYLIDQGWPYFYKVALRYLATFEKKILETDDMSEIIIILKSQNNLTKYSKDSHKLEKIDWKKLLEEASKLQIDETFIHTMHNTFDHDQQQFKINLDNEK